MEDGNKLQMTTKSVKSVYLQAITTTDPATGWIEIHSFQATFVDLVANLIEVAWLTRYQLPSKVIVDSGMSS